MLAFALVDLRDSFLPIAETTPLEWGVLDAELASLARERGAPDAKEARLLREAERMQIWRKTGDPGMLAYMERRLGYRQRCAYERMRVARALGELPLIERALADGALFYSVVRELTRVAIWETEEEWLAAATGKHLREVQTMVRGRKEDDAPEAPSRPENVRHELHHEVDAETYALYCQAPKRSRSWRRRLHARAKH